MATAGQYVTDGTAIFIIRDTRDSTPVGRPITDDVLRDSYVKRNGALLRRSSYPTLVKFLQDNPSLVTTEASWTNAKNMWTWGDGNSITGTTMRVPDDRGLYTQLSDGIGLVAAGLPNITGTVNVTGPFNSGFFSTGGAGALQPTNLGTTRCILDSSAVTNTFHNIDFNAALSNPIYNSATVTPPSTRSIAQMKY